MRKTNNNSAGFTLIEVVIAIGLIVLLTTVLLSSFGPWLRYKQRLDTETRLHDVSQSIKALYKANAGSVDNAEHASAMTTSAFGNPMSAMLLNDGRSFNSNCPAAGGSGAFDAAETTTNNIESNLAPLQPFAATPVANIARDGFNNGICVLVSPLQSATVDGAKVQYHSIAVVALGETAQMDPATAFAPDPSGRWTLTLDPNGANRGVVVDGYQIQVDNIKLTNERLARFAKAYETYFNVRYLVHPARDITLDYFYMDNGATGAPNRGDSNNADPGNVVRESRGTLGSTWVASSFDNVLSSGPNIAANLGISAADALDAWGRPILFDNRSNMVSAGTDSTGAPRLPPFTAVFITLLPGAESCGSNPNTRGAVCDHYISATAMGTY
jgi:type II secretory pathway pseudopilin PulG